MRNYIILNGNNSNEITGLLIQSLPPISKPLMRTAIEEIDGRDGDIVTTLGYSAYDKEVSIGLYGSYDVDEVIKYFNDNSKGQVTFSNEPDKYYNYEIINQIDFERLIRFKTATVTLHCQPFKYPTEETPVEIAYQYVNNEAEEMDLDNTADAPMEIDLKGNTYQDSTTQGNQLIPYYNQDFTINGVRFYAKDGELYVNGTATGYVTSTNQLFIDNFSFVLQAGTYYLSRSTSGATYVYKVNDTSSPLAVNNEAFTLTETTEIFIGFYISSGTTKDNAKYDAMINSGSSKKTYEPFIPNSPSPDYPQDIHVVTGDNTIEICGKNLFDKNTDIQANKTFDASGNINNLSNISIQTKYINVKGNTTYTLSSDSAYTDVENHRLIIVEYDKNKSFIKRNLYYSSNRYLTITTDENTKYVRVGFTSVGINAVQFEESNEATTYEAYTGQSQLISLGVENLLSKGTQLNGYIDQSTLKFTNNANSVGYYFKTSDLPSQITFTGTGGNRANIGYFNEVPANNVAAISRDASNDLPRTINVDKSALYIHIQFSYSNANVTDIQITQGDHIQYISENPIELNKISTYQDYIHKTDKWYLHKEIGKVVLDGSESWSLLNSSSSRNVYQITIDDIENYTTYSATPNMLVDRFSVVSNSASWTPGKASRGQTAKTFVLIVEPTYTLETFKTFLQNNNTKLIYALNTPQEIEITDTTLLEQLENIANARSYDSKTHITQNSNDKPFVLNATAIQKGSDTGIVDNDGNIYSKPTLDIEGTGTVAIYLNGNQMFSVDMGSSSECVIDVTNLEAYDPTTDDLMNRQVTGDYSNFTLPVGENTVKVSGTVTKATITDYTRWL